MNTTEGFRLVALCVRFGSDQLPVGRSAPIVGTARVEESSSQNTKRPDELARIAALKGGPGKLQQELLERLVRLRRVARPRISGMSRQCAPDRIAKRLKTIELHLEPTLDSQIESRK